MRHYDGLECYVFQPKVSSLYTPRMPSRTNPSTSPSAFHRLLNFGMHGKSRAYIRLKLLLLVPTSLPGRWGPLHDHGSGINLSHTSGLLHTQDLIPCFIILITYCNIFLFFTVPPSQIQHLFHKPSASHAALFISKNRKSSLIHNCNTT
jgi:hypothetical protein